ncbi:MAG: flippase-like domain-containing protein [Prevotellaceae bacterium]|jgi:uncharacterized membrane protein YbhN (UPF0104 family)|nr:flippase-like domain-containing protein [Prevotellaceae bacterium]
MPKINSQKAVQNIFLIIGIIALGVMVYKLGFIRIIDNIKETGWWFIPVIALWAIVYALNTFSSMLIIRDGSPESKNVKFGTLYKITLTAFAINAATPVGLIGGEPYKVMELKPYLGITKATSSVILFTMMHIVSHFIFWILSVLLVIIILPIREGWTIALIATLTACLLLMLVFFKGYRKGMIMNTLNILKKFHFLTKRTRAFILKNHKQITTIDTQIASLHGENKVKFYASLGNELFGRIVSCAEIYFLLLAFGYTGSYAYIYSILIVAFVSLMGNLLFFSPMQIGTRELAFLSIFEILGLSSVWGVAISLITRIRELFWLLIGMLLMKITLKDGSKAQIG